MSLYDIKKALQILELFEKSTNAMKLVSLSLYHQLKKIIPEYKEKFNASQVMIENYFYVSNTDTKKIYFFVSSDRGFCGDYINIMFHKFEKVYKKNEENAMYIVIGKMLIKKIQLKYQSEKIIEISSFKMEKIPFLYEEIIKILEKYSTHFVSIYYTKAMSISSRIIYNNSFNNNYKDYSIKKNFDTGHFKNESIIIPFVKYSFKCFILYTLYESLFSEQGARFIAMDGALNNTRDAIKKNQKLYFKVRQQKINNQLQDLVSSLL